MKILVCNDDGYQAKGLKSLVRIMRKFGEVTVVAPKTHQSGMSMAVSIGFKPVAVKDLGMVDGVHTIYVDGTPASAAKYAMDMVFPDEKPDVVVSGINHGLNSSTAAWYSGTIGAAREGSLGGVLSIAVSLDNLSSDADFSMVEELFPPIFEKIVKFAQGRTNVIYNVNFPDLCPDQIKGVKITSQGNERWIEEFVPWKEEEPKGEPGEKIYMMAGQVLADPRNTELTDNFANENGYISITPMQMDNTDYQELRRLQDLFSK